MWKLGFGRRGQKERLGEKTAILQIPSLSVSLESFILALILTQMQLGEQTFGKRR